MPLLVLLVVRSVLLVMVVYRCRLCLRVLLFGVVIDLVIRGLFIVVVIGVCCHWCVCCWCFIDVVLGVLSFFVGVGRVLLRVLFLGVRLVVLLVRFGVACIANGVVF